jgi:hypothetical protein
MQVSPVVGGEYFESAMDLEPRSFRKVLSPSVGDFSEITA